MVKPALLAGAHTNDGHAFISLSTGYLSAQALSSSAGIAREKVVSDFFGSCQKT